MARTYQVVSADGHLETPPDVWVRYVPAKYRERAPRLMKLPEGGAGWVVEGQPLLHNGQNITAGKSIKFRHDTYCNPDGSPAAGAGPGVPGGNERVTVFCSGDLCRNNLGNRRTVFIPTGRKRFDFEHYAQKGCSDGRRGRLRPVPLEREEPLRATPL